MGKLLRGGGAYKRIVFAVHFDDVASIENLLEVWREFLPGKREKRDVQEFQLQLHPDKLFIKTLASGVDFLGWIHFPDHRVLRTATKRRMMKRITKNENPSDETIASYCGLLKHGNGYKITLPLRQSSAGP
jgi:hypothetical protein